MAEGLFNIFLWIVVATVFAVSKAARGQQTPCYFVFGDSVFDNGNNNALQTQIKVNYKPYGVDFESGPTGRFSNGRNIPDVLAELMKFKDYIPPFAGASPGEAHTGINYASGGGGILEETSQHFGGRISLERQINNHRTMIRRAEMSSEELSKCLYTVNIGSNDYLNNYFTPQFYNTSRNFTYDQYAHLLIQRYHSYLKALYDLGARKVALFGISKIGCTPRIIASHGGGLGCAAEVNKAVSLFNKKLKALVLEYNFKMDNAKFTYVDLYTAQNPIIYAALGFKVIDKSCCTVEPGQELCAENKPVCDNRNEYVYWDNVHSTDAANALVAKTAFAGIITFPYSIALLALL